jgi:hypothetical protein
MDFDVAVDLLSRAGITEIATFERRRRGVRSLETKKERQSRP